MPGDTEKRISNRKIKKTNDTVDVAVYTYDALGRRIQVEDSVASSTVRCYYDGRLVIYESDGSDSGLRSYVFGNYIDEV